MKKRAFIPSTQIVRSSLSWRKRSRSKNIILLFVLSICVEFAIIEIHRQLSETLGDGVMNVKNVHP